MLLARRASPVDRWFAPVAGAVLLIGACGLAALLGLLSGVEPVFALMAGLVLFGGITMLASYRAGMWLFIVVYPLSATVLMPRQLFGVTGLNPTNLLFIACLASIGVVAFGEWMRGRAPVLPNHPRYWWTWYVVPITVAALIGAFHVSEIPAALSHGADAPVLFDNAGGYLRDLYLRPMITLSLSALVAYAVARSRRPMTYLVPIVIAGLAYVALEAVVIAYSGASLTALASPNARAMLSTIGVHANELSFLLNSLAAICFFSAFGARRFVRWVLFACAAAGVVGVLLTFSRGGFVGLAMCYALYLARSRNWQSLIAAVALAALGLLVAPDAVWDRLFTGVKEHDVGAISAGRVTDIWLPLLPEILRSPFIGTGLSSVLWSEPVKLGTIDVLQPHNAYLGALLDMGVIGTAAVLAFFGKLFMHLRKIERAVTDPFHAAFVRGTWCLLPIFAVQAFTDNTVTPGITQTLMWCCIGLALGLERRLAPAPV